MRNKKLLTGAFLLTTALSFTACQNSNNMVPDNTPTPEVTSNKIETPMYSNLTDDASKAEVKELLLQAGVSEQQVATFFDWVDEFNANVRSASAFQSGFQPIKESPVNYDDVTLIQPYGEDGNFIVDENCRLTSYQLFQNFIQTTAPTADYDPYLMFDIEALETEPRFEELSKRKNEFIGIYNPIAVKENSSLEEHIAAIQAEWKARGITITANDSISLITMYLHDSYENKRFIGHIGVSVKIDNGYMLIEKYGWNLPFQCTKFATEEDMADYLLSRKDLAGDDTEEAVIVMKNDQVISKH